MICPHDGTQLVPLESYPDYWECPTCRTATRLECPQDAPHSGSWRDKAAKVETSRNAEKRSAKARLTATLPYPPTLNHLYVTVNGRRVLSAQGRAFKKDVGWAAKEAAIRMVPGPIAVTILAYRPRKSGDADNVLKATLDGLSGVCWIDDSQIIEIHVYRYDDKANPRVELEIEER